MARGELEIRIFHRETYVLAVPSDHRFSLQKNVKMSELAGEVLLHIGYRKGI